MSVLSEVYEMTDPEVMKSDAMFTWTERERRALEAIYNKVRNSSVQPTTATMPIDESLFGSRVDQFEFLGIPVRRTTSYRSGAWPENKGVGRMVVKFEVFDGS